MEAHDHRDWAGRKVQSAAGQARVCRVDYAACRDGGYPRIDVAAAAVGGEWSAFFAFAHHTVRRLRASLQLAELINTVAENYHGMSA